MLLYWYKRVLLENYATFRGRARRSEYWYFVLGNIILAILAYLIDNLFGLNFDEDAGGPLYLIVLLGTIIPTIAVMIRRLHDVGKSGVFFLVWFIPIVGPIWLLVLLLTEGNTGRNQYGNDPKKHNYEINEIGLE
ncbi:conserved hypothetical protein; putative inner membrane protein [Flavobacterium sp. 9AF]|uniref:DUF805 domain-containing protein n=1 Tax=Flavobacterium sp. 9AF TaxID=2653142 RepID=UPI0012F416DD|nr:DUF805 domain-containing protein [Flavobacterium sp. 9AF]VXB35685.1 conserved hypothetical protein; putative inner membrane protein [Flavobacterium sp. 9AF]